MVGITAAPAAVLAPTSLLASEIPIVEPPPTPVATTTPAVKRHVTPLEAPQNDEYRNSRGECSCVTYSRTRLPNLPRIYTPADLSPNTEAAVGVAVLLKYKVAHIAIVEEIHPEGVFVSEVNFTRKESCQITGRMILWTDPALRGFFRP